MLGLLFALIGLIAQALSTPTILYEDDPAVGIAMELSVWMLRTNEGAPCATEVEPIFEPYDHSLFIGAIAPCTEIAYGFTVDRATRVATFNRSEP